MRHFTRIGFKQYNPSKPAKYGLLYCSLCDSSICYTYFTLPYTGKPKDISGDAAKYYLAGTDEYTKYLVTEILKYNSIQGCNISTDQYFTSVTLAALVIENKFTVIVTMWCNQKGIPKELKATKDREEKSTMFVYHKDKDMMLVSYIDKKKWKKNIIALTTMHNSVKF